MNKWEWLSVCLYCRKREDEHYCKTCDKKYTGAYKDHKETPDHKVNTQSVILNIEWCVTTVCHTEHRVVCDHSLLYWTPSGVSDGCTICSFMTFYKIWFIYRIEDYVDSCLLKMLNFQSIILKKKRKKILPPFRFRVASLLLCVTVSWWPGQGGMRGV